MPPRRSTARPRASDSLIVKLRQPSARLRDVNARLAAASSDRYTRTRTPRRPYRKRQLKNASDEASTSTPAGDPFPARYCNELAAKFQEGGSDITGDGIAFVVSSLVLAGHVEWQSIRPINMRVDSSALAQSCVNTDISSWHQHILVPMYDEPYWMLAQLTIDTRRILIFSPPSYSTDGTVFTDLLAPLLSRVEQQRGNARAAQEIKWTTDPGEQALTQFAKSSSGVACIASVFQIINGVRLRDFKEREWRQGIIAGLKSVAARHTNDQRGEDYLRRLTFCTALQHRLVNTTINHSAILDALLVSPMWPCIDYDGSIPGSHNAVLRFRDKNDRLYLVICHAKEKRFVIPGSYPDQDIPAAFQSFLENARDWSRNEIPMQGVSPDDRTTFMLAHIVRSTVLEDTSLARAEDLGQWYDFFCIVLFHASLTLVGHPRLSLQLHDEPDILPPLSVDEFQEHISTVESALTSCDEQIGAFQELTAVLKKNAACARVVSGCKDGGQRISERLPYEELRVMLAPWLDHMCRIVPQHRDYAVVEQGLHVVSTVLERQKAKIQECRDQVPRIIDQQDKLHLQAERRRKQMFKAMKKKQEKQRVVITPLGSTRADAQYVSDGGDE